MTVNGAKVSGAKLVEAPRTGGFTFEAVVPWSAFPQAKRTRVGLTGAAGCAQADIAGRRTRAWDHPSAYALEGMDD